MKLAFEELKKVFYKDPTSYSTIYKRNIALENPMWKEIPKNYDKIFYVIPNRFPERYFPLAYFAAKNKMQTNFGYFARVDKKKVKKHNEILEKEIHNRKFSKNTLYVFFNDKLWKSIEAEYPNKTFIIDNYKILTP